LNLHEETQVDMIMKHLPELEFLNGLPVDREILEVENQLQNIDFDDVIPEDEEEDITQDELIMSPQVLEPN
jgi:uncharacterized protein YbbK (DUF523 family)